MYKKCHVVSVLSVVAYLSVAVNVPLLQEQRGSTGWAGTKAASYNLRC